MSVDFQPLEELIAQIEKLPPSARLQLVQRVELSLLPITTIEHPAVIRFGEFAGDELQMSTDEDFAMNEWRLDE